VLIDAFIRYEWIGHPFNIFRIVEGDNRWFEYYGASSRITTVFGVGTDGFSWPPQHGAGLSTEYDLATSLDPAGVPPHENWTAR
jgi:hypothetical protein